MKHIKPFSALILCVILVLSSVMIVYAEDTQIPTPSYTAETQASTLPSGESVVPAEETAVSTEGTDAPAQESVQAPTEKPTLYIPPDEPTEYRAPSNILGDVDSDYLITINDATHMRRYFAGFESLTTLSVRKADTDLDGAVTLIDASHLQRWLAGAEGTYYINRDVDEAIRQKTADDERAQEEKRIAAIKRSIENYQPQKGVDISEFNGDVDMEQLKKQGYTFVIIRLGYGDDYKSQDDKLFETNVKKAEAAGLDWGAYLYSYALSVGEAKSEVQHTLRLLKGKHPTMPIAFDWEDDDYKQRNGMPSNAEVCNIAEAYLSGIRSAGYYPMLYTGYHWLKGAFNTPRILDEFDIWLAQWSSHYDYTDRPLGMWQYGGEENYIESPQIPGLSGTFDKNYCYKNYPMIVQAYGYNNFTALLPEGVASTASAPDDIRCTSENLPPECNGVMGDSLRKNNR